MSFSFRAGLNVPTSYHRKRAVPAVVRAANLPKLWSIAASIGVWSTTGLSVVDVSEETLKVIVGVIAYVGVIAWAGWRILFHEGRIW